MSNYLFASDDIKKVCADNDLISDLIQSYTYYAKRAVAIEDKQAQADENDEPYGDDFDDYELGRAVGAQDALGAILITVVGGKQMYEIWEKTMKWAGGQDASN